MANKLPIQPAPTNETELVDQVGMWANYNFGNLRGPDLGIIEEIGEAVHAILKRKQGIRGFENSGFFLEKFTDALGDGMIYLADYCYIHQAFFRFNRNMQRPVLQTTDERRIIAHLLQAASQMLTYQEVIIGEGIEQGEQQVYNMIAQQICNGFEYWASVYDIDLPMLVNTVWEGVKRRDWKTNSQTAGVGA